MPEYIYLLQEREFKNSNENVYKVGRTTQPQFKRFNQYPKGSLLYLHMICNNSSNMERLVLKKFKEIFTQKKDYGREYFEGNYKTMIRTILEVINDEDEEENDEKQEDEEENDDDEKQENEDDEESNCQNISKIFPDYKNDEIFGGNKKYVKVGIEDGTYFVCYINPDYYECCFDNWSDDTIEKYYLNEYGTSDLQYFLQLIRGRKIHIDKIYDINSNDFITKINKTKNDITIENFIDFQTHLTNNSSGSNSVISKIRRIFERNTIINDTLYSSIVAQTETYNVFNKIKNLKDFDKITIVVELSDYIPTLYKINSKYYDYDTFLRRYIPYVIRWDSNNNYYILNREYEYIGLNTRYLEYECVGNAYLFNDGKKPWESLEEYVMFYNEFKKVINDNSLKDCLNEHVQTQHWLNLQRIL